MNQRETVHYMLEQNPDGVCGTRFLSLGIPRYSARIAELKAEGHVISRRTCTNPHHHHRGTQYVWFLAEVDQPALFWRPEGQSEAAPLLAARLAIIRSGRLGPITSARVFSIICGVMVDTPWPPRIQKLTSSL